MFNQEWEKFIDFFNHISGFSTAVGAVIAIVPLAYAGVKKITRVRASKRHYVTKAKPRIAYFTNREEITKEIFEQIKDAEDGLLFKIYGPAGVGKTEFARLINMIFNRLYGSRQEKEFARRFTHIHGPKSQSFIIDCGNKKKLSEITKEIFDVLHINEDPGSAVSKVSYKIMEHLKPRSQTLFIFDNVAGLMQADELFALFQEMLGNSNHKKCFFMLVYKSTLALTALHDSPQTVKEMKNFSKDDTRLFLQKKKIKLSDDDFSNIFVMTNGNVQLLDIFSNLFSESLNTAYDFSKAENLCDYFYTYIDEADKKIFINMLALCFPDNEASVMDLQKLAPDSPNLISSINKLTSIGLVVEDPRKSDCYSIPEAIFIIFCNREYFLIEQAQVNIARLIHNNELSIKRDSQFIYFMHQKNEESIGWVLKEIERLNNEKNYVPILKVSYLLNHIPRFHTAIEANKQLYPRLIYHILEGLMGAGEYRQAERILHSDKYQSFLAVQQPIMTKEQFQLEFLKGNLLHLLNQYNHAINYFNIIIRGSTFVQDSPHLLSKCYWGIAHCYRHIGQFDYAKHYYTEAINNLEKYPNIRDNELLLVKCLNEMNSIYMYQNKPIPHPFEYIDFLCGNNRVAILSTNKYKAIKLGLENKFVAAIELLENTMNEYKKNRERLLYNLHYEKGELLRRTKDFQAAIECFKISLGVSSYNGDKNIELYSKLGIIASELEYKQNIVTKNKKEQLNILQDCYDICVQEDEVCFELGKTHTEALMQILRDPDKETDFYNTVLPLL